MASEIVRTGRVMFVLWGTPERGDFETIAAQARALHDARGPFVFITRVPAGAAAPPDGIRKEVSRCMSLLFERCASYHGILEGSGFTASAKRAVVATLLLMTPHRGKLHIHPKVEDVASAVPPEFAFEVTAVLKTLEPKGLLTRDLASISPPRPSFAPPRRRGAPPV